MTIRRKKNAFPGRGLAAHARGETAYSLAYNQGHGRQGTADAKAPVGIPLPGSWPPSVVRAKYLSHAPYSAPRKRGDAEPR
ncbi:hypothetical protein HYQ46_007566 [Verticillium longisporum]|nr:hypothetical protein HYQ46_007566 [Verticillium longisporum]